MSKERKGEVVVNRKLKNYKKIYEVITEKLAFEKLIKNVRMTSKTSKLISTISDINTKLIDNTSIV